MTWKQLTERDCREWKLLAINPHDRVTWRSGVRSAMRAASQLPGSIPAKFHEFERLSQPHDLILKNTHNSRISRIITIFVFYRFNNYRQEKVIVDFQTKLFVYHSDHLNCDVIAKKHSSDVFNHF